MSIETYQTTAAAEVLAKIGMPTWKDGMVQFRLLVSDGEFCVERSRPTHLSVQASADHVALCLLRNHLREYTENRGGHMPCRAISRYDVADCRRVPCRRWSLPGAHDRLVWYEDYDEALLASVRAAMEKERP